jgi:hypothetical protein
MKENKQELARNIGRLYTWTDNPVVEDVGLIFDLTYDGYEYHYRYLSLQSGRVYVSPVRYWNTHVIWLTPQR